MWVFLCVVLVSLLGRRLGFGRRSSWMSPVFVTDKLIGVHCTHGLNRTGYLVCR